MADTVNLNGSDQVSNIPAYYYGAVAGFVDKLGKDPVTATFISKVTFPGGTTISTAVNFLVSSFPSSSLGMHMYIQ